MKSQNKTTLTDRAAAGMTHEDAAHSRTLVPKDWEKFQHYKRRKPPWIKLHKDLLDNRKFASMPVDSRALAPLMWLLASESETGEIPYDSEEIAYRLRCDSTALAKALEPLINNGFFIVDGNVLAPCTQHALPETETETQEVVKETEEVPTGKRATDLVIDTHRGDEDEYAFLSEDPSDCNIPEGRF